MNKRLFGFEICRSSDLRAIGNALEAIHAGQVAHARRLTYFERRIMFTQAQQAQILRDLAAQVVKVKKEVVDKVQALEDAIIAGGVTTPEVDAALDDLKGNIQVLDDLNVDPPAPPPPAGPPAEPPAGPTPTV